MAYIWYFAPPGLDEWQIHGGPLLHRLGLAWTWGTMCTRVVDSHKSSVMSRISISQAEIVWFSVCESRRDDGSLFDNTVPRARDSQPNRHRSDVIVFSNILTCTQNSIHHPHFFLSPLW